MVSQLNYILSAGSLPNEAWLVVDQLCRLCCHLLMVAPDYAAASYAKARLPPVSTPLAPRKIYDSRFSAPGEEKHSYSHGYSEDTLHPVHHTRKINTLRQKVLGNGDKLIK